MASYFSHDSNARNSDKLIALRMKMGAEGYGIYFMLLERLREEPDYMSIKDYNLLAFDLRVDAAKLKAVIEDFRLFSFTEDGKRFYSEGFLYRMQQKDAKSTKARESANKRWRKTQNAESTSAEAVPLHEAIDAKAMRSQCEGNAIKESKVKITPPISPSAGEESASGASTLAAERDPGHSPHTSTEPACETASPPAGSGQSPIRQRAPAARFRAPTVAEVADYCSQRNNGVDAEIFVNFYTAKDWMIGKNRMKDWRAAVRTWEKSHPLKSENQPTYQPKAIRL